ncbi:AraC family transcriptional regulator [Agrobacterium vitis]|uniref:AraC family transcriptional regulator n=1 Tax=Agrobacterium vitis TaxID=373 RepID=UPI001573060D|nr:AraC family transcriptional regulator [Agrobacterium vitis]NSZ19828.1 AraC family transcriptional regulator [Agrobacterium vitis]QZO07263.1 AraC family transcriptional regulator [Agrobacterium vitis]UJL91025.1 AraC family transcriptional regulator [Agrobacterium vitis]
MDPLSDILALLKPRSYVSAGFEAGGDWSVQFSSYEGIKCNAVISGQCWLAMEGVSDPVRLEAGDCFLLTKGRPFRLASDLSKPPADATAIFQLAKRGGIARCNGGGEFFLAGSRFTLVGHNSDILLSVLPPIVHVRNEEDQASLRWLLERLSQELRDTQPGSSLVAEHLAHLMLVQALRLYLRKAVEGRVGWLFALADKQIGKAIDLMHADPAHRWTLHELARNVGMSRTVFALNFKQAVGFTPMDYLTRWRMLLASERLARSSESIPVIASSLGYESESAFGAAFKRVMGRSPRHLNRNRKDEAAGT